MFESLAVYLKEGAGLSDEELDLVRQVTIERKLRKRQYLLQEGYASIYNCFVAKGCLRLYRIGKDGAEHILKFAIENWWISDCESFSTGHPAQGTIDALEDSEVLLIKKEDFEALTRRIPKFQRFKERLDARNYDATQRRILSNISETAEERYLNFIKSYPQFYSRVPLHMVASFLGVTRETLSRVRQQYLKS
ncbi:Crp/Fnr family transcriptional regulator [Chitinophaga sp. CF418]|uniref:Crp/Fnr family transcriptional regulator n=1 Tax=Chitinophaga sp. CF418 TaxID=1855287 RepID=UPI000920E61E|nr:Crp/Fnr family transcriptional regulator [Chitinophaga sp. CF418]SHN00543.1 cAMP-binding domain of CRP or a regulatory subunit of cAMP-dependent protein kinases [Chitinophaga sp. CF418]